MFPFQISEKNVFIIIIALINSFDNLFYLKQMSKQNKTRVEEGSLKLFSIECCN